MSDFALNYFNYFTEIEEHFQRARGTGLFLLSPLDWALVESWKSADVPLEAVLRGIDGAFEKWRSRRSRSQMVNSLAFCVQAVMTESQRMADAGPAKKTGSDGAAFAADELRAYLELNANAIRRTGVTEFEQFAASIERLSTELPDSANDLEELERRLTAIEQRMIAAARASQTEEAALAARRELEGYLKPYKSKMSAAQIMMLEVQFLERNILEFSGLPRLSLFYLR